MPMCGQGCGDRDTDGIPVQTIVALSASHADRNKTLEYLMKRRFLSVGTLVTAAGVATGLALAPLAAANAAYTHSTDDFEFDADAGDLCAFSVHLTVHNEIDDSGQFPTGDGGTMRIVHVVETDTIAANGVTVHGLPYHYTLHFERDRDGNLVRGSATGGLWKFALPDGGIWSASGVNNFLTEEHIGSWKTDDLSGPVCDALAG